MSPKLPVTFANSKEEAEAKEKEKEIQGTQFTCNWWEEEEDERANQFMAFAKAVEKDSMSRLQACLRFTRLYENAEVAALAPHEFAKGLAYNGGFTIDGPTFNVTANCLETLTAKVTKNKPEPMFVSTDGNWLNQTKAKELNKFARGLLHEVDFYNKAREVFIDAGVSGTGALHIYREESGRLCCERVFENELFVDDMDGYNGSPRILLRRKFIQPDVLAGMFPEKRGLIATAKPVEAMTAVTKLVEVWEGWHLPSSEGAGDGLHIISLREGELFSEPWKVCCFPIIFLRFMSRRKGFWGKGLIEKTFQAQRALNRATKSVDEQIRRKGKGRVFVQMGSKVNTDHLTNGIGDILYYNGAEPKVDNGNAVAQEEILYIERLVQKIIQDCGLSELSVSARKPSGLDSSVALLTYNDIESERFVIPHQDWENLTLDFVSTSLELLAAQWSAKAYKVKVPSGRYTLEIDFKDLDFERDMFTIKVFPVSSLPNTPSGRYERVMQMKQDGVIDGAMALRLLNMPDVESEYNMATAALEDADATISAILDNPTPELRPVEPYQDAKLIAQRATAAYLYSRNHGAEEHRLDLLRQLIDQATTIIVASQPEPQAPAPAMAMPPMPMGPMPGMPMPGPAMGDVNVNVDAAAPLAPAVPPIIG